MFRFVAFRAAACAAAVALGLAFVSTAGAQTSPQHIRGTLSTFGDQSLTVKTTRGTTETIGLTKDTGLFAVRSADIKEVQPGRFVGITSVERDGKSVAREVHVFAEALRGRGEGHYPWDLGNEPSMMTNADLAQVQQVGKDRVVTAKYKGGETTISVPQDATIVLFDKTTADQLKPDSKVFVIANKQPDGKLVAAGVVVGAGGIRPPM